MGCISAGRFCAEGLVLADLFGIEFWGGDCEHAAEYLKNFIAVIQSPNVPPQDRQQMITTPKKPAYPISRAEMRPASGSRVYAGEMIF